MNALLVFMVILLVTTVWIYYTYKAPQSRITIEQEDETVSPSEIMDVLIQRRGFESIRMTEPFLKLKNGSTGTFMPYESGL